MYEDVRRYQNLRNLRKERFLRMQTLTRPSFSPTNNNTGDSQALRVAVMAAILFALSGLITGFAFGAFVHFSPAKTNNPTTSINTSQQKTGSTAPVTTPQVKPVAIGLPLLKPYSYSETADGATWYSATVQVTDITKGLYSWGNSYSASGITCKLWLVQHFPDNAKFGIPLSIRQNIQAIPGPITGTVNNQSFPEISGLNFDPNTPQTQLCHTNGQATWKYQVSPSVKAGKYDLVVLTDWDGKVSNWSWYDIKVTQAS